MREREKLKFSSNNLTIASNKAWCWLPILSNSSIQQHPEKQIKSDIDKFRLVACNESYAQNIIKNVHMWIDPLMREKFKPVTVHWQANIRSKTISTPLKWCYTGGFVTTIFSGTQRCNVGLMFQLFETMLQQCWNVALRLKSSLQIVPCNITFSLLSHVER